MSDGSFLDPFERSTCFDRHLAFQEQIRDVASVLTTDDLVTAVVNAAFWEMSPSGFSELPRDRMRQTLARELVTDCWAMQGIEVDPTAWVNMSPEQRDLARDVYGSIV